MKRYHYRKRFLLHNVKKTIKNLVFQKIYTNFAHGFSVCCFQYIKL